MDDIGEARRLCERWLAAKPICDDAMYLSTAGLLMAARCEHFDMEDSRQAALAVHDGYRRTHLDFGLVFHGSISGAAAFAAGDPCAARALYEDTLNLAINYPGLANTFAASPALLLAEVHYEQNRLEDAQALVLQYIDVAYGAGYVDKLVAGYITKARLELLKGQHEPAQRTLDEAERCALTTGFERLRVHVVAERMRQFVHRGLNTQVLELAQKNGLLGGTLTFAAREGATTKEEMLALAWARAASVRGDLDGAIRLIKNWVHFTASRAARRSSIRLGVELSRLMFLRGNHGGAYRAMVEALRATRPGDFVRTFLDGGPGTREVLGWIANTATHENTADTQHAAILLDAFAHTTEHAAAQQRTQPGNTTAANLQRFTRREIDILELAGTGVPNKEIGKRMSLSENTVKWYWKSIFAKLGVRRRFDAVNAARAAGVLTHLPRDFT